MKNFLLGILIGGIITFIGTIAAIIAGYAFGTSPPSSYRHRYGVDYTRPDPGSPKKEA